MPQLNPKPWFNNLTSLWSVFMLLIPYKLTHLTKPWHPLMSLEIRQEDRHSESWAW